MIKDQVSIRSIQHYLYCPHRWGLIEIDRAWSENIFVTKANLMHQRVHEPDRHYISKGKKVFTSVPVYNDADEYNLYGYTDCIEVQQADEGTPIPGLTGKFDICIVEYKPRKPKDKDYNVDDLLQVFAQKICVDYVFHCDCRGELYYADVKKRIKLPLQKNFLEYDKSLKEVLSDIRSNITDGTIPPIKKGQNCNGCSMKDMCMPLNSKRKNLKLQINEIWEEEI